VKPPAAGINNLPYRLGVGMMILDKYNRVFVGSRRDTRSRSWQMPQGGIDLGETPSAAVMREMEEEIGCNKGYIIAESRNWYCYRIPKNLIPKLWEGQYCGQKQKWFLIRFTGDDEDIDVNTMNPEFQTWKWVEFKELLKDVVPFKLRLYKSVIREFRQMLQYSKI
jgi:putative (di)nucleoside polyphosphate hydrolase